jgi:hypothetical protein
MSIRAIAAVVALLLLPLAAPAELPKDVQQQLASEKYVYVSSTRKDGSLSTPAEIWFMWHDGAVYVGTRPTSWRVKRLKAGRPQAKIAVGSAAGPSFMANGSLVADPAVQALMLETYAKKYPEGWQKYADSFRDGFKDGSRVLVKYVPNP